MEIDYKSVVETIKALHEAAVENNISEVLTYWSIVQVLRQFKVID